MNDSNSEQEKEVICHCSGTTGEKIRELIEKGTVDLDRISRITGACSGCGSCDAAVIELLEKYGVPKCNQQ